jgi:hypothetical protein
MGLRRLQPINPANAVPKSHIAASTGTGDEADGHGRLQMAVTCYSSASKNQSQYRPFRVVIFLTRAQQPRGPNQTVKTDLNTALAIRYCNSYRLCFNNSSNCSDGTGLLNR